MVHLKYVKALHYKYSSKYEIQYIIIITTKKLAFNSYILYTEYKVNEDILYYLCLYVWY